MAYSLFLPLYTYSGVTCTGAKQYIFVQMDPINSNCSSYNETCFTRDNFIQLNVFILELPNFYKTLMTISLVLCSTILFFDNTIGRFQMYKLKN